MHTKTNINSNEIDSISMIVFYCEQRLGYRTVAKRLGNVTKYRVMEELKNLGLFRKKEEISVISLIKPPSSRSFRPDNRKPNKVKLNEKQKKLIEKEYGRIRSYLSSKILSFPVAHKIMDKGPNLSGLLDMILSYLPQITLIYKEDIGVPFVVYAVDRCSRRIIDAARAEMNIKRRMREKQNLVAVVADDILKCTGSLSEDLVIDNLSSMGLTEEQIKSAMQAHNTYVYNFSGIKCYLNPKRECEDEADIPGDVLEITMNEDPSNITEWTDTKYKLYQHILSFNFGKFRKVAVPVFIENIIAAADNRNPVTIKTIGKRVGITESRVSQIKNEMIRDPRIKKMIYETVNP